MSNQLLSVKLTHKEGKLTDELVRSAHICRPRLIEGVGTGGFDLMVGEVDVKGADSKSELSTKKLELGGGC